LGFGVLGAVTLSRHSEFLESYQDDVGIHDESSRGQALALATDLVMGLAALSAIATLVVGLIVRRLRRRQPQRPTPGFEVVGEPH
jgi:hypothetical protein